MLMIPALFTSMSMRPNSLRAVATAGSQCSGLVTSRCR